MALDQDLFRIVGLGTWATPTAAVPASRPRRVPRGGAGWLAVGSGAVLVVLVLLAVVVPMLAPATATQIDLSQKNLSPSGDHLFGTDSLGRDIWVRTWEGAQVSLTVALAALLLTLVIGVTVGLACGYAGGWADFLLQRAMEIIESIPNLVIVTLLVLVLRPGVLSIVIAFAIAGWIPMSRVLRAQVLKLREADYVLASRSLGTPAFRIAMRGILPNALGPIIVSATFTIPAVIFMETFLSFVGLGVPQPAASLGSLLADGTSRLSTYPYMIAGPLTVFGILLIALTLLGNSLQDMLLDRTVRR